MFAFALLSLLVPNASATTFSSLSSSDVCTAGAGPGYIVPLPAEDGFYLGHRFGPFSSDVSIGSLSFTLAGSSHGDAQCDSTLIPDVVIWTSSSSAWPSAFPRFTPAVTVVRMSVAGVPVSSASDYGLYGVLGGPMTVKAGNYVFVALQESHDGGDASCYVTCSDGSSSTTSMYSDSDGAPFGWDKLSSFGIHYDTARIYLFGS